MSETYNIGVAFTEQGYADVKAKIAQLKKEVAFNESGATIKKLQTELGALATPVDSATKAMAGLGHATTGTKRELMVMAHEFATGNWKNLAGSFQVLMESTGGLKGALAALAGGLSFLLNPFVLVGIAAAALGAAFYLGSRQSKALNDSLILTGNYAANSAAQLQTMSSVVAKSTGATQGKVMDVMTTLISTGRVGNSALGSVTAAAIAMEKYGGKAVDDFAKDIVKLGDDPVKASAELNKQSHYLTTTIYEQIVALKAQGREDEAAALAQTTYANAFKTRADTIKQNLGYIEKLWIAIKDATQLAIDKALEYGRNPPPGTTQKMPGNYTTTNSWGNPNPTATGTAPTGPAADAAAAASRAAIEQAGMRAVDYMKAHEVKGAASYKTAITEFENMVKDLKASNPMSEWLNPARLAAIRKQIALDNRPPVNEEEKYIGTLKAARDAQLEIYEATQDNNVATERTAEINLKVAKALAEHPRMTKAQQAAVKNLIVDEEKLNDATKVSEHSNALDREVSAMKRVADAYGISIKAGREADIQSAVETTAIQLKIDLKTKEGQAWASTEATKLRAIAASSGLKAFNEENRQLEQQLKDLVALNSAKNNGLAATRLETAAQEVDNDARAKNITLTNEQRAAAIALRVEIAKKKEEPLSLTGGLKNAYDDWVKQVDDMGTFGKKVFDDLTTGLRDGLVDSIMQGKFSLKALGETLTKDILGKGIDLLIKDSMDKLGISKLLGQGAADTTSGITTGTAIGTTAAPLLISAGSAAGAAYAAAAASGQALSAGAFGTSPTTIAAGLSNLAIAGEAFPVGFAKGAAFHNGIVSRPTIFPMARGMGLMGEAGPEVVAPLGRDSRGRMGVHIIGGNSSRPVRQTSVVNNFVVQGPVDRRSQQQVAAAAYRGSSIAAKRNGVI